MISNIYIDKVAVGIYEARIEHCGGPLGDVQTFDRIETAIKEIASELPPKFGAFLNFVYGGMCTGTVTSGDAQARASLLADRLVDLNAELRRREEKNSLRTI